MRQANGYHGRRSVLIELSYPGQQQGAILVQYNLNSPSSTPSGIWDVHARIGGFAGSNLQLTQCPTSPTVTMTSANVVKKCIAAFLSFHITVSGSGLYMENDWIWTADHDVEDPSLRQITVYTGRGFLDESKTGTVWMVGTSVEHFTLYQYQFANTKNVFAGQVSRTYPPIMQVPNLLLDTDRNTVLPTQSRRAHSLRVQCYV